MACAAAAGGKGLGAAPDTASRPDHRLPGSYAEKPRREPRPGEVFSKLSRLQVADIPGGRREPTATLLQSAPLLSSPLLVLRPPLWLHVLVFSLGSRGS